MHCSHQTSFLAGAALTAAAFTASFLILKRKPSIRHIGLPNVRAAAAVVHGDTGKSLLASFAR